MIRILSIILLLQMSVLSASGALTCSDIFKAKELAQPSDDGYRSSLGTTYFDLPNRVLENFSKGSFEAAKNTALNLKERRATARSLNVINHEIRNNLSILSSKLSTDKPAIIAHIKEITKALDWLDLKVKDSLDSVTYVDSLSLALQVSRVATRVDRLLSLQSDPEKFELAFNQKVHLIDEQNRLDQSVTDTNQHINSLLQSGIVLVPTHSDLTIKDINLLLGSGLAPMGLASRGKSVDGMFMTPLEFSMHDLAHAYLNASFFSKRSNTDWQKVFRRIEIQDAKTQEIMHGILFLALHESRANAQNLINLNFYEKTPFSSADPWIQSHWLTMTHQDLVQERYFGQTIVSKNLPTYEEFMNAHRRLLTILTVSQYR